jgi:hypothetical protein
MTARDIGLSLWMTLAVWAGHMQLRKSPSSQGVSNISSIHTRDRNVDAIVSTSTRVAKTAVTSYAPSAITRASQFIIPRPISMSRMGLRRPLIECFKKKLPILESWTCRVRGGTLPSASAPVYHRYQPSSAFEDFFDVDSPATRPMSETFHSGTSTPNGSLGSLPPSLTESLLDVALPPWTLSAFMAYLSQSHCMESL